MKLDIHMSLSTLNYDILNSSRVHSQPVLEAEKIFFIIGIVVLLNPLNSTIHGIEILYQTASKYEKL